MGATCKLWCDHIICLPALHVEYFQQQRQSRRRAARIVVGRWVAAQRGVSTFRPSFRYSLELTTRNIGLTAPTAASPLPFNGTSEFNCSQSAIDGSLPLVRPNP